MFDIEQLDCAIFYSSHSDSGSRAERGWGRRRRSKKENKKTKKKTAMLPFDFGSEEPIVQEAKIVCVASI